MSGLSLVNIQVQRKRTKMTDKRKTQLKEAQARFRAKTKAKTTKLEQIIAKVKELLAELDKA